MVAEPIAMPVTTPVALTDATEVLLLCHEPPEVVSVNVVVEETQIEDAVPVIVPAEAYGSTSTTWPVEA